MTNHFPEEEQLYRAVYPPEVNKMFWKDDNHVYMTGPAVLVFNGEINLNQFK